MFLNSFTIADYNYFTVIFCQIDSDVDRAFYIAQKVAEGSSLASLIESGWRATEKEIERIAIEVCVIKRGLFTSEKEAYSSS